MQQRIKEVNLVLLLTVIASILLGVVYDVLLAFGIDIFAGSYALQLLYSQVIFALPTIIYLIFVRRSIKVLRFKKIDVLTLLLCILMYICISPVLTFINLLSQLYSSNLISNVMFNVSDEVPFALGLLLIAIVPAVFEEVTYRGLVFNTIREKSPLLGIIICGLVFGLMHGNLNQFTYAFILGMFFALVVEATDSLWSTVTIHFLVNMSSIVIIYLLPVGLKMLEGLYDAAVIEGDTGTMDLIVRALGTDDFSIESVLGMNDVITKDVILSSMSSYAIPAIVGGVLAFLLFRLIAKRRGRWEIICGIFGKKQDTIVEAQPVRFTEGEVIPTNENGEVVAAQVSLVPEKAPTVKIFTWELVTAIAILVIQMASNELLLRFAATLQ